MLRYVLRRLGLAVITVAGIVVIVFGVTHILPGNPALVEAGGHANAATLKAVEQQMGLDRPLAAQFWSYLVDLAHGSLGTSFATGNAVTTDLLNRLPATVELAVAATVFAVGIGVPAGILAGMRERRLPDWLGRVGAIVGTSIPLYWLGLVLIVIFYTTWHVAPAPSGQVNAFVSMPPVRTHFLVLDSLIAGNWSALGDALGHLVLPAITLGIVETAPLLKITRSATLDVVNSDFVRTARAYGLPSFQVLRGEILRNVATQVLTSLGIVFGFLLGGSILVERIFSWPGIGLYAWNAVTTTTFQAIQGYILTVGLIYVILNLVIDLLYAVVDPRIRLGSAKVRRPRHRGGTTTRRLVSVPEAEGTGAA